MRTLSLGNSTEQNGLSRDYFFPSHLKMSIRHDNLSSSIFLPNVIKEIYVKFSYFEEKTHNLVTTLVLGLSLLIPESKFLLSSQINMAIILLTFLREMCISDVCPLQKTPLIPYLNKINTFGFHDREMYLNIWYKNQWVVIFVFWTS